MRIKAWGQWWTILRTRVVFCEILGTSPTFYVWPLAEWRLRGLQARRRWAARNLGGGR